MLSPGKLRKLRQLKVSLLCQEQQSKSQENSQKKKKSSVDYKSIELLVRQAGQKALSGQANPGKYSQKRRPCQFLYGF